MCKTAYPVDSTRLAWIPLREGLSFRPLHFADDGYALHLRVEPGVTIPRHRHTGEVHAINLSGVRRILGTDEAIGPGVYVFEPPGNVDSWACEGDEPCVVHIVIKGRVEYLDDQDRVSHFTDSATARQIYLDWCWAHRVAPDLAVSPDEVELV